MTDWFNFPEGIFPITIIAMTLFILWTVFGRNDD